MERRQYANNTIKSNRDFGPKHKGSSTRHMPEDVKDALNLAINCMKTVQFIRGGRQWSFLALFPDEAPDENEN